MYQNYLSDAIGIVSAWDVPDEEFAQAVNDRVKLMSGISPEDSWETISG